MKDNNDLLSGDNLLNQITNISKASAYDILVEQVKELKAENEKLIKDKAELLEFKNSFYMDICRAYNAGKQNQINIVLAKGSPDEDKMFISSHDYFKTEFPEFKTNVP